MTNASVRKIRNGASKDVAENTTGFCVFEKEFKKSSVTECRKSVL